MCPVVFLCSLAVSCGFQAYRSITIPSMHSQFQMHLFVGVGKMRLVRLGASASSNIRNSYQIKPFTLVHTLSLPLILYV